VAPLLLLVGQRRAHPRDEGRHEDGERQHPRHEDELGSIAKNSVSAEKLSDKLLLLNFGQRAVKFVCDKFGLHKSIWPLQFLSYTRGNLNKK
jgi:hypothetical protein